jgi:hypothetical protein
MTDAARDNASPPLAAQRRLGTAASGRSAKGETTGCFEDPPA